MATGTAVAVVKMNRATPYVDPKKLNVNGAKGYLARVVGPKSPFAGSQIRVNGQDGYFQIGFGEGAKQVDGLELVINVPQTMAAWQYWPDNEAPSYPYIAPIFGDATIPNRDACGPEETKYNKLSKKDEDVWSESMVLILRSQKTNALYHMICTRNLQRRAAEFIMGLSDAPELSKGMLPVVGMDFEKVKLKSGESFRAITFEVLEWVKATAADLPKALDEASVEDEPEDEKPAAKTRRSAMQDKAEDAEYEDVKPSRATASEGNGRGKDPRNNPRTVEDDEADEKPARRSRGADADEMAESVRTKHRRDATEDDEKPRVRSRQPAAEDDDEKPRARRAAREEPEEETVAPGLRSRKRRASI